MSSSTCQQEESSALREEKEESIRHCLAAAARDSSVDLWRLRELALTKGGLVHAELRKRAWPILVGLNHEPVTTFDDDNHASLLDKKDLDLIQCDAGRSVLFQYHKQSTHDDSTTACSSGESSSQQHLRYSDQHEQLTLVLTRTLAGKSGWHYYQGLHDIAGVLLYNLQNSHNASAVLSRLCRVHLRDSLREDLRTLTSFVNAVLFPLVKVVDEELHDLFYESGMEASTAILPWIVTWFTHDIRDAHVASRLVDAFLSAHPLFPLYFAVAVMIHPKSRVEILTADLDAASIHVAIRSLTNKICGDWTLPNEDCIAVQDLIDDAITILRQHSPRSLLCLARIYIEGDGPSSLNMMTHSVAFLRAPPSWAMASSISMRHQPDRENTCDTAEEFTTIFEEDFDLPTHRAKCASGVSFLMSSADQETVLSKRLETCSSSCSSPRSVTTQWELCQQILFGNYSTEESLTFSTCFASRHRGANN